MIHESVATLVGHTPIIRIHRLENMQGAFAEIYAKLEYFNPAGSVKDRVALEMIEQYEKDGLLRDLDKWCVVEWPKNFQHGYDVDIEEWKICHEAHVAINAYYIEAIKIANKIAEAIGEAKYRDITPIYNSFIDTFYVPEKHLFRDGENTDHTSLVGNSFAFAFELYPNVKCRDEIIRLYREHTIHSLSMFCVFPTLMGLLRCDREDLIKEALKDEGAWLRTLREGGTTTYEGWGKDTKWNTSLFHLTMSYAATFISDNDIKSILK